MFTIAVIIVLSIFMERMNENGKKMEDHNHGDDKNKLNKAVIEVDHEIDTTDKLTSTRLLWLKKYVEQRLVSVCGTKKTDAKFIEQYLLIENHEKLLLYDYLKEQRKVYNRLNHPEWELLMPTNVQQALAHEWAEVFMFITTSSLGK